MDVDSLKTELEKHLARNPDEHAPHGFRDRFSMLVEQYQADGGEIPKSVLETELQQIRNEAEAAANCVEHPLAEPAPRAEAPVKPAAPSELIGAPADEQANPPAPGFAQRYGLALVVAVVVLAAAWYFFRR
jgi:hypothetical protein